MACLAGQEKYGLLRRAQLNTRQRHLLDVPCQDPIHHVYSMHVCRRRLSMIPWQILGGVCAHLNPTGRICVQGLLFPLIVSLFSGNPQS